MPTLFIVATPIGNLKEVSQRTIDVLNNVDIIACEDTRNSKKLLSHFNIHTKCISYHNFNEINSSKGIIKLLKDGNDVALISDAGYPLISDPGYIVVNEVIKEGFDITTISGANACLNALVASGLETQHYLYFGFLNAKQSFAKKQLEEIKSFPYTIVFYEAPHRIEKTIKLCFDIFGDRKAVLARELTKLHETYYRGMLSDLCKLSNLKGEMVLLIEGYKKCEDKISSKNLILEIKSLINNGTRTKEAIGIVAEKYNISKNNLYKDYLKNKD